MADKLVSQDPTQPGILKVDGPTLTSANEVPLNGLDPTGAVNGDVVTLSGGVWTPQTTASIDTASNEGAGIEVFDSKVGNDFQFRTIVPGDNTYVDQLATEIVIGELNQSGAVVMIVDQKPQNTSGGTFTSGAWRTRDLNTILLDEDSLASVVANQITLLAGEYRVWASCPAYTVGSHTIRLQDLDNGITLLTGTSMVATVASTVCNNSILIGNITLLVDTTLELQHRCSSTFATSGFGLATNLQVETYSMITFTVH